MTMTSSEVGIGNEEVETRLKDKTDELHEEFGHHIQSTEVNSDILAGVAHIEVDFEMDEQPGEVADWMAANDLVSVYSAVTDDGHQKLKITTLDIYSLLCDEHAWEE